MGVACIKMFMLPRPDMGGQDSDSSCGINETWQELRPRFLNLQNVLYGDVWEQRSLMVQKQENKNKKTSLFTRGLEVKPLSTIIVVPENLCCPYLVGFCFSSNHLFLLPPWIPLSTFSFSCFANFPHRIIRWITSWCFNACSLPVKLFQINLNVI